MTFDTVKQITLCDILSSGMTLLAGRVILPFWNLDTCPIDLLEIEMTVKKSKGEIHKEVTDSEQNAHVETSHFYFSHILKLLPKIFLRVLTDKKIVTSILWCLLIVKHHRMEVYIRIQNKYHQSWAFNSYLYHLYVHKQELLILVLLYMACDIMTLQNEFCFLQNEF